MTEAEPQTPNTIEQNAFMKEPVSEEYKNDIITTPKIVYAAYALLLAYGIAIQYFFKVPFWHAIVWYLDAIVCFFIWHWFAHQKWTGLMHSYHMEHHFVVFPPRYFFGNPRVKNQFAEFDWRDNIPFFRFKSLGTLAHDGPMYVLGFGSLFLAHAFGVSKQSIFCGMFELICIGTIAVYLHNSFHVKGHFLENFNWFQELRALHYIHHLGDANHNYAIMNFSIDKVLHLYHDHDTKNDIHLNKIKKEMEQIDHDDSPLDKETIHHVKKYEKSTSFHTKMMGIH
jgi:hypothetical protein